MSNTGKTERPSKQMAQATAGRPSESSQSGTASSDNVSGALERQQPTVAEINLRTTNEREWIARHRGFFGDEVTANITIDQQRLGQLKHAINIAASGVRSLFSFRNPMALIGGVYSFGMAAWDMRQSLYETGKVITKRNNYRGYHDNHIALGISLVNQESLRDADGKPIHVPEFLNIINSSVQEAKWAKHGKQLDWAKFKAERLELGLDPA